MLNCGPVINVVGSVVQGEGALFLFIMGACIQDNNKMALPNSETR